MYVTPFLVSFARLTRYSARSPGHGFVPSECHLQLRVKSHAHAGITCSIKALCDPSTPNSPFGDPLPSSQSRSLNNPKICMSFTIATAMIFTAFAASLAMDSDANQNAFGAWSKARDRRYTIGDHRCPLVVRVVLNATANGSGEGSQSAFDTTNKHLIFRRRSGGYWLSPGTQHDSLFVPYQRDYAVTPLGLYF